MATSSDADAQRAAQATLETLADRLPRAEARHILQELPAEMKPWIYTETEAAGFGIDEFLDRVARREGTDHETALRHARAVFGALGQALSPDAVAHLAAVLPKTFDPLLAEAQGRIVDIMPASQFWDRVGQRLSVDAPRPARSPRRSWRPWRSGSPRARSRTSSPGSIRCCTRRCSGYPAAPEARRMPLEDFLRRVATRERIDVDEAGLVEEVLPACPRGLRDAG